MNRRSLLVRTGGAVAVAGAAAALGPVSGALAAPPAPKRRQLVLLEPAAERRLGARRRTRTDRPRSDRAGGAAAGRRGLRGRAGGSVLRPDQRLQRPVRDLRRQRPLRRLRPDRRRHRAERGAGSPTNGWPPRAAGGPAAPYLCGIPMGVKDSIAVEGFAAQDGTTTSSATSASKTPPPSAACGRSAWCRSGSRRLGLLGRDRRHLRRQRLEHRIHPRRLQPGLRRRLGGAARGLLPGGGDRRLDDLPELLQRRLLDQGLPGPGLGRRPDAALARVRHDRPDRPLRPRRVADPERDDRRRAGPVRRPADAGGPARLPAALAGPADRLETARRADDRDQQKRLDDGRDHEIVEGVPKTTTKTETERRSPEHLRPGVSRGLRTALQRVARNGCERDQFQRRRLPQLRRKRKPVLQQPDRAGRN